jgi:nucleotide-binding universal stress UspA family protein
VIQPRRIAAEQEVHIMGRRIVVGLDGTEYSAGATQVGIQAVRKFGGSLIGVAVVDSPGIEASSRGAGIGAYEYAKHTREQRLSDAHQKAEAFLDQFERDCQAAGIHYELAYHVAVPLQALVDEGRFADAIVVGSRTHFRFETRSEPGDTVRRLMEVGVCPVVAVPKGSALPERALVAFDGSIQAARALRAYMYVTSSESVRRSITLLHVCEGTAEDEQVQLIRAQQYAGAWGFDVEVLNRTGRASDVIAEVAGELAPCVVVMGAYGRRGVIQKLFFGSTAARLIEREQTPLFVYH